MLVIEKLQQYDRMLTSVEVGKLLNLHASTVTWYAHRNLLPCVNIGARSYRFDPHELIAYLEMRAKHLNQEQIIAYLKDRGIELLPEQVDKVWRCVAEITSQEDRNGRHL